MTWKKVLAAVALVLAYGVARVDAGAVTIILSGQSNMVGQGRVLLEDTQPGPYPIAVVTGQGLRDAREPWAGHGSGLGRSFAQTLLQRDPSITQVWLVQCAVGGTSITQWLPNAPDGLLARCVRMAQTIPAAFKAPVVAILWAQGEQDAHYQDRALAYGARLRNVVNGFRQRLGGEVPFIASELPHTITVPGCSIVVEQTRSTLSGFPATGFVDTGELTAMRDRMHYERASLRRLGVLFADKLHELVPTALSVTE